jgi:hypothetical protein
MERWGDGAMGRGHIGVYRGDRLTGSLQARFDTLAFP